MPDAKLRQQIAFEAARLMYYREESEYMRAKTKAARRLCRGWVKPKDLPSNREIRDQVQALARMFEGDERTRNLRDMRIEALRMMRILAHFRPRLIGSVLTGHVREGSDIDIHLFSNLLEPITAALEAEGLRYDTERKQIHKQGAERVYRHIHVPDRYMFELTVYDADQAHVVMTSSITGKPIERMSIPELEAFLEREYPNLDVDDLVAEAENRPDRFLIYQALLAPLEKVKQSRKYHPEGDALYHSLQVFELAREQRPYDEEFLLAALLHDVGKAIDTDDHVQAGLEALGDFITERTGWFIKHHMEAHALCTGALGTRSRRRLEASDDYDDLLLLRDCDVKGRQTGVAVPEIEEALEYLRELAEMCGE